MFGPDKRIWELEKSASTAADVIGRSYMKSFYEGSVPHGRRKSDATGEEEMGSGGHTTAWVNGQQVTDIFANYERLALFCDHGLDWIGYYS